MDMEKIKSLFDEVAVLRKYIVNCAEKESKYNDKFDMNEIFFTYLFNTLKMLMEGISYETKVKFIDELKKNFENEREKENENEKTNN